MRFMVDLLFQRSGRWSSLFSPGGENSRACTVALASGGHLRGGGAHRGARRDSDRPVAAESNRHECM